MSLSALERQLTFNFNHCLRTKTDLSFSSNIMFLVDEKVGALLINTST